MFGSRAIGDNRANSDYDILVIGDFEDSSVYFRSIKIVKKIKWFNKPVDLIAITPKEYETCLMRSEIGRGGIILYERVLLND